MKIGVRSTKSSLRCVDMHTQSLILSPRSLPTAPHQLQAATSALERTSVGGGKERTRPNHCVAILKRFEFTQTTPIRTG